MIKKDLFYRVSMLLLAAVSGIALVLSLLHIRNETVFSGVFCGILLGLTGLLTAVCLCLETARGNLCYRVGFYVLHGGIVVLLAGFLLSRFLCTTWTVSVPVGEDSYRYVVNEETGEETDLGFYLGVSDTVTAYYTDADGRQTENPKYYEATVTVTDPKTLTREEKTLTVNHPLRLHGTRNYKVYLMHLFSDQGSDRAVLLLKSDNAEYTVLAGIVLLISGSILMCFFGELPPIKKGGDGNVQ